MFGALMFGQGYFAQGPPGVATLDPVVPLDLCTTTTRSLMPIRTSRTLMATRTTRSLMPVRTTDLICHEGD